MLEGQAKALLGLADALLVAREAFLVAHPLNAVGELGCEFAEGFDLVGPEVVELLGVDRDHAQRLATNLERKCAE